MNIIIVDDDKLAANALAEKLKAYEGSVLKGIAHNGTDGLNLMMRTQPDLLFLDIELPDISGLEFLERIDGLNGGRCRVVMYTAHDRFMLQAFRNKAFDYLMKPIDDADLRGILRRACIDRRPGTPPSDPSRLTLDSNETAKVMSNGIAQRNDGKYIVYTNTVDFRLVDIRDIGIFTYNHELRVWEMTLAGQSEPIRLKRNVSSDMLTDLNDALVRVSQKHIINLSYLMEVTDNTCRFYPPFENLADVKVGRFFRKKLIDRFSSF